MASLEINLHKPDDLVEIKKFAGGENHVKIKDPLSIMRNEVIIKTRINSADDSMNIVCIDQCTKEQEENGLLQTVFLNGVLTTETDLSQIRETLNKSI